VVLDMVVSLHRVGFGSRTRVRIGDNRVARPWWAARGGAGGNVDEEGPAAAARLIVDGAQAVICANDVTAIGAMRAARRLRGTVPGDLSVIGYACSSRSSWCAARPGRRARLRRRDLPTARPFGMST
jgi:hypothetical protein